MIRKILLVVSLLGFAGFATLWVLSWAMPFAQPHAWEYHTPEADTVTAYVDLRGGYVEFLRQLTLGTYPLLDPEFGDPDRNKMNIVLAQALFKSERRKAMGTGPRWLVGYRVKPHLVELPLVDGLQNE